MWYNSAKFFSEIRWGSLLHNNFHERGETYLTSCDFCKLLILSSYSIVCFLYFKWISWRSIYCHHRCTFIEWHWELIHSTEQEESSQMNDILPSPAQTDRNRTELVSEYDYHISTTKFLSFSRISSRFRPKIHAIRYWSYWLKWYNVHLLQIYQ